MTAYYNENDPKAAAWLRELIKHGHIAPGDVDERSIVDVRPGELKGYTQAHFFAGIGGWSYALRLAGWPDDRPVWTGSCPCQPFSVAGKGRDVDDERHLWPVWRALIRECSPSIIFGEQVSSPAAMCWLALVQDDLEGAAYSVASADLCAAGVGAPHIRQRLYWVAVSSSERLERERLHLRERESQPSEPEVGRSGEADSGVAHADDARSQGWSERRNSADQRSAWAHSLVGCRDGKWRPVEPVAQSMANGISLALECLRNCSHEEREALTDATKAFGFTIETVRALREGNAPTTIWRAFGGRIGLPQATLLLAVVCEQAWELGPFFNGPEASGEEECEAHMRALWGEPSAIACAPQRQEFSEQHVKQLGDAVSALSQKSARIAELLEMLAPFNGFPLAHKIPGRVGLLRGYGNAIVPQVAAAFIEAATGVEP